jgi:dihydropyrimidinase
VLSRGDTVYADGKVVSEPGHGRFVKRSLFEPAAPS